MNLSAFAVGLGALALSSAASAQILTMTTVGTVPRLAQPNIPNCSTNPEPYYFQVSGSVGRALATNEEIRLIIRPILLNGGPIFGCEWITQCLRPVPDMNGGLVGIGQFGTNGRDRTWFAGQQADVQFVIVNTNAGVGVCINNPIGVTVARSNITRINIDPALPTLFDWQLSCMGNRHDVQGTPTPGQTLTYTLPSAPGGVIFGLPDINGSQILGCPAYVSFAVPPIIVGADAMGMVTIPIPNDPALAGLDLSSQGIQLAGAALDLTQPTLISIR